MGPCGDTATTSLGMTKFQKVGQLIAVFRMNHKRQRIGCFLLRFHGPALCVFSGVLGSGCSNLILDGFTSLADRCF